MTGHRCPSTHRPIFSHQRALKSSRWWTANGRPTIPTRCEGCGGWHTKHVPPVVAAPTRTKESA